MQITRRSILGAMAGTAGFAGAGGVAASGVTSSRARAVRSPSQSAANQLVVGPGGDFQDIRDAITSISENSPENPFQVLVLPGVYGGFDSKPYVDVVGAGIKSTILETSGGSGDYIRLGSNTSLGNCGVVYRGTAAADLVRGAIEAQGGQNPTEIVLKDIEIDVSGISGATAAKYAINFNSQAKVTAWNLRIATESGGLRLGDGQSRWHNCDIYLKGTSVGLPHYGVRIDGGNRFDFYGGRIGTGYYYDADLLDPDQDVIGLFIPAANNGGNTRAEVHGAEMFARNITPAAGVKVNAVRAENGWARLYGCFCQCEITPDTNGNASKSLYAAYRSPAQPPDGTGGKIEAYGCRVRSAEGYVIGGPGIQGSFTYDASNDDTLIQRYENLCVCDASAGTFTLKLGIDDPPTDGDEHVFKRIDASPNVVIIDGNGSLIDGKPAVALRRQYARLRVRRAGSGWHVL
jgi:hypothetical protein